MPVQMIGSGNPEQSLTPASVTMKGLSRMGCPPSQALSRLLCEGFPIHLHLIYIQELGQACPSTLSPACLWLQACLVEIL